MKRILWFSNTPAPYRVEFWEQISENVEGLVIFANKHLVDRSSKWYNYDFNFEKNYLTDISGFFSKVLFLIKTMKNFKPDVYVSDDYSNLYSMLLMVICKFRGVSIVISADGGIVDDSNRKLKFVIKFLFGFSNRVLSSGEETDKYFEYFGVPKHKIYHYTFSSLTKVEVEKNRKSRKTDHFTKNPILLTVGSTIPRKGIDILIKAVALIEEPLILKVVGGKATEEMRELVAQQKHQVYFIDHVSKEELTNYYNEADIFVLATRKDIWGLVINEAASFGLPIVCSDNCVAGKEFISNKKCGLLFESENYQDLAIKITEMLSSDLNQYSQASYEVAEQFTIEKMVSDHIDFFEEMLGKSIYDEK